MRNFTKEEQESYNRSLDKLFQPLHLKVLDLSPEDSQRLRTIRASLEKLDESVEEETSPTDVNQYKEDMRFLLRLIK